ncbi:uncharacterized protein BDZ99DRAFT_455850 [Mytilinidion resinicola]|uniref:Uncharacterized protein n=1 Tax=Mytilinidion resinicola TaxID=574789 RepID=A0A6A6Y123_9PEZI|nr:uncharacterized protein BDZ99DRAFT_455850 [Mytilinidion resinicola]KAF2801714.1 hypothetical protein BDZ99DRAFT_455850 [Mytilinidion resinicola]
MESSDDEKISTELHRLTRDAIVRSLATRRPLLHHLNADTTWLLQIPRPASAVKHSKRIYYNILIDPWLTGGQSDVASWFSQQWHATPSAVSTIDGANQLAREIEHLAGASFLYRRTYKPPRPEDEEQEEEDAARHRFIDAIAISHEFTDHCHPSTLKTVHRDVPVFCTDKAALVVNAMRHFRAVHVVPTFTSEACDWRANSLPPLPEWLSISRIVAARDFKYYHSALMIAFNAAPSAASFSSSSSGVDAAEVVIYTPHGIPASALAPVANADPPLSTLAFLHGLHSISIGSAQQLNLGGHNGLQAQRVLNAKYWVGTHDEVKAGLGIVSWFLRRKVVSVEEASSTDTNSSFGDEWDDVKFEEIPNGESRVLE